KIFADARQSQPLTASVAFNAFASGTSRSPTSASRSGRLRSAGWLAAHRLASMLRRRGFHPLRELLGLAAPVSVIVAGLTRQGRNCRGAAISFVVRECRSAGD